MSIPSSPVAQNSHRRPTGSRVLLMATCLCDTFYADVAKATVEVLEHCGCEVVFPEDQTCCGQPAFNSGDFESGRQIALHTAKVFNGSEPIIVPSGSCAAMHLHGHSLQFEDAAEENWNRVKPLTERTWELCDFLKNGLQIESWEGSLPPTQVALHHSCHTRGSQTGEAMHTLLAGIEDLEVVEFGQKEQCCGFGGTFSVTFPHVSAEMGHLKLDHIVEEQPDKLVSADMSCLMHLSGLAAKQGDALEIAHISQILRDAIQ